MRILFLDCFSGISGDMTVAALHHLGVAPAVFTAAARSLGIPELGIRFDEGENGGIGGMRFIVEGADSHQPARHFSHIAGMIGGSGLDDRVKSRAVAIFRRIAEAEATVHGVPVDHVHFHEVGALDSVADIVCAAAGFEALGVDRVLASRLTEGSGWVECAHGRFPLPSPATLEILRGIPVGQTDEPFEFITPTGAAIVSEYARAFGPMPTLAVERIGYGLGTRRLPGRPNALRAVLGIAETNASAGFDRDTATLIETNLDDLSPELLGPVVSRLLDAGALDAWFAPIQMKKNRPAILLSALVDPSRTDEFAQLILRETSAFGVRIREVSRLKLARRFESVETPFGAVTIKIGEQAGEIWQAAPEFESCKTAADRAGVPVRTVYLAALKAREDL
jgi:uncharacterized protein (TIGR00299 family) protein